jgi:hypothetical protein
MKAFRYIVNTILFIIFWVIMCLLVMKYSIDTVGVRPSGIIATGGLIALIISYLIVKRINESKLWGKMFDKEKDKEKEEEEEEYSDEEFQEDMRRFKQKILLRLKILGIFLFIVVIYFILLMVIYYFIQEWFPGFDIGYLFVLEEELERTKPISAVLLKLFGGGLIFYVPFRIFVMFKREVMDATD